MTAKTYNFEGGTNGSALTTSDTGSGDAVNAVDASEPTYSTAAAWHGTLGMAAVNSATSRFQWTGFASTSMAKRFYYKVTIPTASTQIAQLRTAAGQSCGITANASGVLNFVNMSGTGIGTSTNLTSRAGTVIRIEYQAVSNSTTGSVAYQLFDGDGTTAFDSNTFTSINTRGGNLTTAYVGNVSGGNYGSPPLFDGIAVTDGTTTPLGPEPTPAAATGALTLSGTAAAAAPGTATGALTLTGSADVGATATGALTLTGTGGGQAASGASGALALSGSASASAAATATGALSLTGAAVARSPAAATAALSLSGTAAAATPAAATAALTLTGSAAAAAPATATGALVLTGTATTGGSTPASASGAIVLTGTVTAGTTGTATAALSLTATAGAAARAAATGALTFTSTAGSKSLAGGQAALALAAFVLAAARGSATATITLTGLFTVPSSVVTPRDRTSIVRAEQRIYAVEAEIRVYRVRAEQHVYAAQEDQ